MANLSDILHDIPPSRDDDAFQTSTWPISDILQRQHSNSISRTHRPPIHRTPPPHRLQPHLARHAPAPRPAPHNRQPLRAHLLHRQRLLIRRLRIARILPRVRNLILQPLEQRVHRKRQQRAQARPQPVDPVISLKPARHHRRPEAPHRVDACAREVRAGHVRDEDADADAHRREERRAVLLHGEEVHRQHELCREEHFDEEALRRVGAAAEAVCHVEMAWEQGRDDCGGGDARGDLRRHDDECSERLYGSDEDKSQRDLDISLHISIHV